MVNSQAPSADNPVRTTLRNLVEVAITTVAIAVVAHVNTAIAVNEPSSALELYSLAELVEAEDSVR